MRAAADGRPANRAAVEVAGGSFGARTSERADVRADQAELEQIVERLERGEVELEELTRLWERGEELYRLCAAKLEAVHGRIEELARTSGDAEA